MRLSFVLSLLFVSVASADDDACWETPWVSAPEMDLPN